jgi:hypothetical protein
LKKRKTEKSARRKLRNTRTGEYPTKLMGKPWTDSRKEYNSDADMKCEICGCTQKAQFLKFRTSLAGDHIVPARMAAQHGNPHHPINQMNLCSIDHGHKTGAENALFGGGGMLGYISELRKWNWPMDRVAAALKLYGIYPDNLAHLFVVEQSAAS